MEKQYYIAINENGSSTSEGSSMKSFAHAQHGARLLSNV
jgi:hypothetical protein